ncbi:Histone acetyltransferase (MYST family) [Phaffia rhodozyma]|uniref:histone acetyltransferase n=1 Tax=Phaffia rhodozyma TaxID=264483 RepID=A0A0F7SS47_PHARH|nr:Histone acetyltransferase (MYST family) [Phaffia rhodozyma]
MDVDNDIASTTLSSSTPAAVVTGAPITQKTKSQLRHEKEKRALARELSGRRKDGEELETRENVDIAPEIVPNEEREVSQLRINPVRNFNRVRYSRYQIDTGFFSPYPLSTAEESALSSGPSPSTSSSTGKLREISNVAAAVAVQPQSNTSRTVDTEVPSISSESRTTLRAHGRTSDLIWAGGTGSLRPGGRGDLFVCDGCFKYCLDFDAYDIHHRSCTRMHPPGIKVYTRGNQSIWEVDGEKETLYCQFLSLFGKLFIDSKGVFYSRFWSEYRFGDIDTFMFYVLTDTDRKKDSVIGFFSKEKHSLEDFNVACIIVLPPWQSLGYGRLMIEFSYELTRSSPTPGTPERPLSALGLRGYISYWASEIARVYSDRLTEMENSKDPTSLSTMSIQELAVAAHIRLEDLVLALQECAFDHYVRRPIRGAKEEYIIISREILDEASLELLSLSYDPVLFTILS